LLDTMSCLTVLNVLLIILSYKSFQSSTCQR